MYNFIYQAILAALLSSFSLALFSPLVTLAISWLSQKHKLQEANTITIFLSVSMALGIILISLKKGYSFDLESYLFGNVLMVSPSEIYQLIVLALLDIFFISFFIF